jgi:hypothetical protein
VVIDGNIVPLDFKIRRILLPVAERDISMVTTTGQGLDKRTSDNLDLGNAVAVTEDNTDLGRGSTLSGELADLVDDLVGGGLQPGGRRTAVGNSRGANTLSLAVHTTVAS